MEREIDLLELIANLARRVSSLEQQLKDTQGNVERQAEEIENMRRGGEESFRDLLGDIKLLHQKAEMLADDIVMLDERTQPKEVKTFKLTDLAGRTLQVYSATDVENGVTTTTTVAIDIDTSEMFVLEHSLEKELTLI